MFRSPEFWVAVALVIFLAIAWKMGAFKTLLAGLDNRSRRIQAELDEAKRLREEASRVLADYTARREAADREANAAEAAVKISETVLRDQMKTGGADALMARSLGEARAKLHA
jgi:F-type H+-transporting ATPase subunit b